MMKQKDIVIVGAGMVGLTCALALAPSGLKVAVIDAAEKSAAPAGEPELRVSAVSKASQSIFENLGVWQHLNTQRITPYTAMQVWEQDSFARIGFKAADVFTNDLGHIIENRNVTAALTHVVERTDNVELITGVKIDKLSLGQGTQVLQLADGELLTCRFVIGADGANSMVGKVANFAQTWWDYDQKAIVATVQTQLPHEYTARQVFTPHGPLALLPLWQPEQCSIVWSQSTDKANELLSLDESDFNKALATTFDMQAGQIKLCSARQCFPLKMRYARQWLGEGAMVIGDAAHTIHPLAGQGANLGLLDAASVAEQICQLVEEDKDFTQVRYLRPVERWRKAEAAKMVASMETFKRLFSGEQPLKKLIRGAGMSLVNEITPLKSDIIKQAMGISGKLPELAVKAS
ncbi:FAD-dependent oxidoreductase [Planctobacterium marinum]|uniref:2-octaprenyl-6-methoxyphenol hydroxylase n=1 Tax=Planctobacterium marinum TaxID=1631968 RepID=A0AA48HF70_9ALTE|nr:2-octaprenyl-6-methoxyphenol hydroxylase [Planctobacterium marinum]